MSLGNSYNGEFDSGAVAVTDVGRIQADGNPVQLALAVGAGGAIAHLKVAVSPYLGGQLNTLAEDSDFGVPTAAMPWVLGTAPVYQTAANGTFALRLAAGAAEYVVYAKTASADTTLRVSGRVLPR